MNRYTTLTQQVVQTAPVALQMAEIVARVEQLRPITTRSPQQTIRKAIGQCSQIVNLGDGRYGWYPRLLQGSRVRVELKPSDLALERIILGKEVRDLLWPAFFANQIWRDQQPIRLYLRMDRMHCSRWISLAREFGAPMEQHNSGIG